MTASLRCRPGDLAVVISAVNAENLGTIVTVVALHDGQPFNLKEGGAAWRVRCPVGAAGLLYVYASGRRVQLPEGPIRDCDLQPIRGSAGLGPLQRGALERPGASTTPQPGHTPCVQATVVSSNS
jgi:hypothetical protein